MHEICHVEIPTTDLAKSKECTCGEAGCLVYIKVASVDDKAKELEAAGGKVTKAKTAVGDIGWYALFQDSAGGVAALWEAAKKD